MIENLPVIITSTVIRSSSYGDEHGAIYLVNLENGKYKKAVSSSSGIKLDGRGGERGFRGVAFYNDKIYAALSNKILIFNKKFSLVGEISEPDYMFYIHEICIYNDLLYIVSTDYDAILVIDLKSNELVHGLCFKHNIVKKFDKTSKYQPIKRDTKHLNNVYVDHRGVFTCGVNVNNLFLYDGSLSRYAAVPNGTHNCRPFKNGVLCNMTNENKIAFLDKKRNILKSCSVKKINIANLVNMNNNEKIAKQPFARGLAVGNDFIVGGSSPSMISVYDLKAFNNVKNIIMSNDVRFCIHGIEIYPYKAGGLL